MSTLSKYILTLASIALVLSLTVALNPVFAAIESGSLTTTFASNNGCFGNMFDVTAFEDLTITSFDQNLWTTGTQDVTVYYKAGTYVGSETTPGDWTLLGTVSVTGAGDNLPTPINIGGLDIPAGQTYGIFIDTSLGNNYTNGDNVFTNTEMEISAGAGFCTPFTSPIASRTWNGTIYYEYEVADPEPEVPAVNFPNKGEVLISANTPVYAYAAAGEYMTNIVLPADYDGNGYDTYTVTGTATVAGETWYAIWVGGEDYLWVPASQVTVIR